MDKDTTLFMTVVLVLFLFTIICHIVYALGFYKGHYEISCALDEKFCVNGEQQ